MSQSEGGIDHHPANHPRPRLTEEFEIETPEAGDIDSVVLIRPSATTHCVDPEQRLVSLEFRHTGADRLSAMLPTNPNVLPPGYYMLFILVRGVPSVAKWVKVG